MEYKITIISRNGRTIDESRVRLNKEQLTTYVSGLMYGIGLRIANPKVIIKDENDNKPTKEQIFNIF